MKNILATLIVLPFLALTACDATSENLYRPSEAVEEFEAHEQKAEFQNVKFNPEVDILFVIDDSRSMKKHITSLSRNIKRFVEAFASHDQIDFHIGVTTVWDSGRYQHPTENPNGVVPQYQIDSATGEAKLDAQGNKIRNFWNRGELIPIVGSPNSSRFVSRTEGFKDQIENTLLSIKPQEFIKGGQGPGGEKIYGVGPEVEELFSPVVSNLTDPTLNHPQTGVNRDFWRPQSHKVFVFLTDADDATPGLSYDSFNEKVQNVIGGVVEDNYSYYSVMHNPKPQNRSCAQDPGIRGLSAEKFKLHKLLGFTDGRYLDICKKFGDKLAEVGEEIRDKTLRKIVIPLQKYPEFFDVNPDGENKEWLEVKYGEQKIPVFSNEEGWGWTWDPENNLLVIRGVDQVEYQEGAQFSVDFTELRL